MTLAEWRVQLVTLLWKAEQDGVVFDCGDDLWMYRGEENTFVTLDTEENEANWTGRED